MSGIRYPDIKGATTAEQMIQTKNYLKQLVDQLNFALASVTSGNGVVMALSKAGGSEVAESKSAQATFNSIKSLIIKSADIVEAYYDVICKQLDGIYVAQSDFGKFREETSALLKATSDSIDQLYSNIQEIITDIENVEHTLIEVNAHIKTGLLYYDEQGVPVYGVEVGQRTELDGVEVFNKYAQFTASRLAFFDNNGNEVAYISDMVLYISNIKVTVSFSQGGFIDTTLPNGDVISEWGGYNGS